MKSASGRILAAGLLLLGLGVASCGKPLNEDSIGAPELSTSLPRPVSTALSSFSQSMTTNCDRPPPDLCAEQLRVLAVRAEAVVKELRSRSDLANSAEGVGLGETVVAMRQQDLANTGNQRAFMESARKLDAWLKRTVPGYPPSVTSTGPS